MDVVEVLQAEGAQQQGLLTKRQLLAAGVSEGGLSAALARGRVVRVGRGVYAAAALPVLPRWVVVDGACAPEHVLRVRAALLELGPRAAASGRTAAALRGWPLLVEPRRTVQVDVPHGHWRQGDRGLRVRQRRHPSGERLVVLPGTAPLRVEAAADTVLDAALRLPLLEAVVLADSALRLTDLSRAELTRTAAALPGVRAAARARAVLALADPRAESPLESVLRVRLVQAGLTGATPQLVVRDLPGLHLRVDLAFEEQGLVLEGDGQRWHRDRATDASRDRALAALGWRVLRFSWHEVVREPAQVVALVRAALAASGPSVHLRRHGGPCLLRAA